MGSYAVVVEVQRGTERSAAEVMDKSKIPEQHKPLLRRETAVWRSVDHENVVRLLNVFEDERFLVLQCELVDGCDLFQLLMKFESDSGLSDRTAQFFARRVALALQYLHRNLIAHRDIKLENILFDSATGAVKLCDFGFAQKLESRNELVERHCGTVEYESPEILKMKSHSPLCSDIWAFGVLLHYTLTQ